MSNKLLTQEEVQALKASAHVESVSSRSVVFTPEFKKTVYEGLLAGKKTREILEENGIDTAALGNARISGLQEKIIKASNREDGFENLKKRRKSKTPEAKEETITKRIRQLENELAYTKQEVEFLKKIQQADTEARKSWESKHRQK
jgi:hypothetical protein